LALFLPDVYRIPFGVPANARLSSRGPMTREQVAELLDQTFRRVVAAESVAAIVVEPVLGEGGFVVPPAGFLPALAKICRERGIVFIADEVQTGFGRTGELFASTHFGIEPDLIITAKSLRRWHAPGGDHRPR
jgi:4-aminobutyrate aminotransferase/(S)-3-amino-2-methylpropionate transaminase